MNALEILKQHGLGGLAVLTVVFAALFVAPRLNEIDRKQFEIISTLDNRTKRFDELLKSRLHRIEMDSQQQVQALRNEMIQLHARLLILEERPVASPEMLRVRDEILKRLDRLEERTLFPRHHSE